MYPGLSLGDRYTLEDLIGTSTGGSVWTGHDTVLDRPVRIKVLGIALSAEESNRARFRQSTLEVTTLQVPGVIDVFDCVEHYDEDQILECQIAERVDGKPLSRILNERSLGIEGTLSLVATAAWVLNEAHEAGARHLNLKPTNVIVAPDGSVTITDFAYLPTAPTHPYAAPEQRRGESAGIPADVFSLGAIAYECVTGGPPASDATLPEETAPAIAAFIGRALSPNPAHRFGSAAILATECEQILHTSDVLDALLARSEPEPESQPTATEPESESDPEPEPLTATAPLPKRTPLAAAVEPPPDPEPLVAAAPEPVAEPDPEPEPLAAADGPRPWDVEPEPGPPPVTVTMEWRDPKPQPIDPEPELLDPDEDPRLRDPKPRVREAAVPSHSHARKAKPRRKRLVLLAVVALAVVAATALTVTTLMPDSAATSAADDYDPDTDDSTESTTLSPSESKEDHDRGKSDDPTSEDFTGTSSSSSGKPSSPSPTKSSSSDDSPDPPQKVKVPNVVGDDKADAIAEIKDADLQYNVIKSGEGDFECPIFDQSPDAGTSVVKGTTVDIELKLVDNAEQCDDGGDDEPARKP